jgi:polyphosphate kinase
MDPSPEPTPPAVRPYLDREHSWLQFNSRVLELAEDKEVPLLERVRFCAIFADNLDEFFMVRVAGLKRRIATGAAGTTASGLTHREVLQRIWTVSRAMMERHARVFQDQLRPELAARGIEIQQWEDLSATEQEKLYAMFRERIFPVLTPLAVDPAHPFPYISGLSLNLAVVVRNPVSGHEHFARVKVPSRLPRFVQVQDQRFLPLEALIAAHLPQLFNGMEVLGHHAFRVTRNEDVEVEGDDSENLLDTLERELMRRRFGPPVRLEVEESIDPQVLELLIRELGVDENEVFALPAPLDLTGLFTLTDEDRPELKFPPFATALHRDLTDFEGSQAIDVFGAIRQRDILLHHPYDSFTTSVQAFLEQAAADPDVRAIKQTLYRTSGDSPIVDALIDAAEAGKEVLVLIEIKARFDEHANIVWARKLEQAGCHVVYGLMGLKTHCKLSLVVRQEGTRLRRYAHIGTGNYNPKTARIYEDLGLLTCDPQVGEDLTHLFNRLSGYSRPTAFHRLLTAPSGLRDGVIERIERERDKRLPGRRIAVRKSARIRMKMNSLVDETVIDALYAASQAGVQIDLVVRGMCALRPGVPGLSDNIRVCSVLGRFLEHSRVYAFGEEPADDATAREAEQQAEVWIGSADMMHRNLDRRVEALVRIAEPTQRRQLISGIDSVFAPDVIAWDLGPDGEWIRRTRPDGQPMRDIQASLIDSRNQAIAARRARLA